MATTAEILQQVAAGQLSPTVAAQQLEAGKTAALGFANVDLDRQRRNGFPEVIYGAGKTATQIVGIVQALSQQTLPILTTRLSAEKFAALQPALPTAVYHATAQCMTVGEQPAPKTPGYIAVVTAGTSDQPVAEEAAVTAETLAIVLNESMTWVLRESTDCLPSWMWFVVPGWSLWLRAWKVRWPVSLVD